MHHRSWADLTFQPSLDWKGGGVRGDCVAGELEYIMPKYCDPVPRDGSAATLRKGEVPFPSEQRLAEIDVRTRRLQPYVRRLQPYLARLQPYMCTACAPGAHGQATQA